ncbi:MAG: hypothetical protein M1457_05100, partial [bacterium]|nr:hypothetical protein [bacterium]
MSKLRDNFDRPPYRYRMLQIMHQYGSDRTSEETVKYLDQFGYGGVVTNVSFKDYLDSEENWGAFVRHFGDVRSRGMDAWIYDEKGYPSGKAGGKTMESHPEFESLGVVFARSEGHEAVRHAFPKGERYVGEPLLVVALPVTGGVHDLKRAVDLTDQAPGRAEMTWEAPDGAVWAILSFHRRRMYEGTHCVTNLSDPLPYINIADREAVARFIELTHEAYRRHLGDDRFRQSVQAIFTDEPSLMTAYFKDDPVILPAVPWSRTFREEFRARAGYDIVPHLPALFVDCAGEGGADESLYRRLDFWKVASALIEENFYGQIQDWCRAHGTAASGHALCEEHLYWHVVFEGDLYRDLRRMDVPGMDNLTSHPLELARAEHIPVTKFLSSVTHMTGAAMCMSETSSHVERVYKRPVSFAQRLGTINLQYAQGLTRVTSYYQFQEFSDEERRRFNDHIGRLGAMLTGGRHVADIALFYPVQSMWSALVPTTASVYK